MAIACTSEDGNQAVVLVTNLENGDSLSPCPDCLPGVLHMLLEGATARSWVMAPEQATEPGPDDPTDEPEHGDGPTTRPTSPTAPAGPTPPAPSEPPDTGESDEPDDRSELQRWQAEQAQAGQLPPSPPEDVSPGTSLVIDGGDDDAPGWSDDTVARALADDADTLAADPR